LSELNTNQQNQKNIKKINKNKIKKSKDHKNQNHEQNEDKSVSLNKSTMKVSNKSTIRINTQFDRINQTFDKNTVTFPSISFQNEKRTNKFIPLITNTTIETALLNLNKMAVIEDTANCSFSILILIGKIEIIVYKNINNKNKKKYTILNRESVIIIEKGEKFILRGLNERNRAVFTFRI
ncbi:hypothetical protein M153_238000001, partial [Pseudoloma neurophilia]